MRDLTIATLGGLATSEDHVAQLMAARDELAAQLFIGAGVIGVESLEPGLSGLDNIVGIGIGRKAGPAASSGRAAIKVFVQKKLPTEAIAQAALVPEEIQGFPTDVEEVGVVLPETPYTRARLRPMPGGASVSNILAGPTAGTLGCYVYDANSVYVLSNNHVLANSNASPLGGTILQPGWRDGGNPRADGVAALSRFVPLGFQGTVNLVDAAIAAVNAPNLVLRGMQRANGQAEPLQPPHLAPVLGMQVQKSGRTTGHTKGIIDTVGIQINIRFPGLGMVMFGSQFRVVSPNGAFSEAGDSGSLVTTHPGNQPVGLLFAGGMVGGGLKATFCNPIDAAISLLSVAIAY